MESQQYLIFIILESLKLISRNKSRTHPVNIWFQIERTIEIHDYLNFASNLNMKA